MKVSGKGATGAIRQTGMTNVRGAEPAWPAAPIDAVAIAGIPEAELTPRVREALEALMTEVSALRTELAAAKSEIRDLSTLANEDPLLGVLNRRAFVGELDRTLAFVDRYDEAATLVFVDVDDMKGINDRHGHEAGDAALAHIAQVVTRKIRKTDVFGRLGGDEFGIILTRTDLPTAQRKLKDLATHIETAPVIAAGATFTVAVSFGTAPLQGGTSASDILGRADAAMYENKRVRKG